MLNSDDKKVDNNRINIAIHQAQLRELVTQLPLGVETNLGEHGVRLSGGSAAVSRHGACLLSSASLTGNGRSN